ncbi:hypothetical protein, partial [Actinomyces israelii]
MSLSWIFLPSRSRAVAQRSALPTPMPMKTSGLPGGVFGEFFLAFPSTPGKRNKTPMFLFFFFSGFFFALLFFVLLGFFWGGVGGVGGLKQAALCS